MANLVEVHHTALTTAQFGALADVLPELEWLANLTNAKTRRAYRLDVREFSTFMGLHRPADMRRGVAPRVCCWG